jgi:uncharacterized protein YjbI with pentapeptide repeats
MALRSVIMWTLFSVIVVFVLSTGVQAQELREVNASDILKQIENNKTIFLQNVTITGKLDLSNINLTTVPNARSARDIVYYGLEKELKIVKSNIKIRNSVFKEAVDFSNTEFRKDSYFIRTSFSNKSDFSGANFAGDVYIWNANFAGDAYFGGANFARDAYFWDANFAGDAYFGGANFARDAKFGGANFTGDACFDNANFAGAADFRNADFTGNTSFRYTEFDEVSFEQTTFTNVSLNETDYNQMYVEWSSLKDALLFYGPTYIKLIKNFREMEQFEDADAAYYQYRQLRQENKKWSDSSKLMDVVAGLSCGYGIKPEYPLIWGFILIIVFAFVYKLGNGIKRLKSKENGDNRVSFWDAFYFSVTTFTTVGYGDWYPEDRYRKFVMIEGVLGWLLLALFLVTLANVMIRL